MGVLDTKSVPYLYQGLETVYISSKREPHPHVGNTTSASYPPLILWVSTLDPGSPADLGCSCVVRGPPGLSGHCHNLTPTKAELPNIVCLFRPHHYSPAATHPYRLHYARSPRVLLSITSFSGQLFHRYTQLPTLYHNQNGPQEHPTTTRQDRMPWRLRN